jgi:hypothetical protein
MSPEPFDPAALGARLPEGARPPFSVFVRGIELVEGDDYTLVPGGIALHVAVDARRESWWRDLVSTVVGIGFYRQGDYVDVGYQDARGHTAAATLPVTRLGRAGGDARQRGTRGLAEATA